MSKKRDIERHRAARILAGQCKGHVGVNPELLAAADKGNTAAQAALGSLHLSPHPDVHNPAEAHYWLERAANGGNNAARIRLGLMLLTGEGALRDPEQAIEFYMSAALENNTEAQFRLAMVFQLGTGVPRDLVSAYAWYTVARVAGATQAIKPRQRLRILLSRGELEEAERLVERLQERIRQNGN